MAASIAETVARDRLPAAVILSPPLSTVSRSRTSALRATGDRVSSSPVRSFARRSVRFSAEGSSIRPSRLARSSMAQAGSRPPSHVARSGFGRLSGAITAGWLRALRDREGGPASVRVSRRRPPCTRHAPEHGGLWAHGPTSRPLAGPAPAFPGGFALRGPVLKIVVEGLPCHPVLFLRPRVSDARLNSAVLPVLIKRPALALLGRLRRGGWPWATVLLTAEHDQSPAAGTPMGHPGKPYW